MSKQSKTFLVTGATGVVGTYLTHLLLEHGHHVRALVHRIDGRSEGLSAVGAQIVEGDLLDLDSVCAATRAVDGAYFSYPIAPGLLEATAIFAQAAADNRVGAIVNMSQKPARPEAGSNASRQHWLSERIFNQFPVPATHIKPTFFAEWLIGFLQDDNTLRLPFADGRHAPITGEDQALCGDRHPGGTRGTRRPGVSALRPGGNEPHRDRRGPLRGPRPNHHLHPNQR
jgi:NAD(P)H dehydrogenase (quinone)